MRSAAEIVATLDADGCLEGVPFMPEMLRHLGQRYSVEARVERACDTINHSNRVRRMPATVILDDLRCAGSAHGGCQARCRLYWKEAWLQRTTVGATSQAAASSDNAYQELGLIAQHATRVSREGEDRYRCQATEFLRATKELGWWDMRSFARELRCGNVGVFRFARVAVAIVAEEIRRRLRFGSNLPVTPAGRRDARKGELDLRPGDLVQVRPRAEIEATLDAKCRNRGLWFDHEMVRYLGERRQVVARIERFIEESSGKMIELKSDCVALEGVVCSSYCSYGRWFCPRAIHSWWREAWLRRVDDSVDATLANGHLGLDDVRKHDNGRERNENGGSLHGDNDRSSRRVRERR